MDISFYGNLLGGLLLWNSYLLILNFLAYLHKFTESLNWPLEGLGDRNGADREDLGGFWQFGVSEGRGIMGFKRGVLGEKGGFGGFGSG